MTAPRTEVHASPGRHVSRRPTPVVLLGVLAAAYAIYIVLTVLDGYRAAARGEVPLYTDFTTTYAAALAIRELPAELVYLAPVMLRAGRQAAHATYGNLNEAQALAVGSAPIMYPPIFSLLIVPFAYLSYLPAWIAWTLGTAIPYLAAMRRLLPGRIAIAAALAAPPTFFNVMYGQTGFLTAGLIGLGLLQLRTSPWLAGVAIGLASFKPHFGVLLPLVLAAGGHWRTFLAATLTVLALVAGSLAIHGEEAWFAWIGTSLALGSGFESGAFAWAPMVSVLSGAVVAGLPIGLAWAVQLVVASIVTLLVVAAWYLGRRRAQLADLQAAMLITGTLLVVPMAYVYDQVLLCVAAAFLWREFVTQGAENWERRLVPSLLAAILVVPWLARTVDLQAGPLIAAGLFVLAARRFARAFSIGMPGLPSG